MKKLSNSLKEELTTISQAKQYPKSDELRHLAKLLNSSHMKVGYRFANMSSTRIAEGMLPESE